MATLVSRINDLALSVRDKFNSIAPRLVPTGASDGQVLSWDAAAGHLVWISPPTGGGASSGLVVVSSSLTNENYGDGSVTVAKPSGTVAGDLLVAVYWEIYGGGAPAFTGPTGWSTPAGGSITHDSGEAGVSYALACFSKVAGAGEPSSYTFGSGIGGSAYGQILRVPGAVLDVAAAASTFGNNSATVGTYATVSLAAENELVILASAQGYHDHTAGDLQWPNVGPQGSDVIATTTPAPRFLQTASIIVADSGPTGAFHVDVADAYFGFLSLTIGLKPA